VAKLDPGLRWASYPEPGRAPLSCVCCIGLRVAARPTAGSAPTAPASVASAKKSRHSRSTRVQQAEGQGQQQAHRARRSKLGSQALLALTRHQWYKTRQAHQARTRPPSGACPARRPGPSPASRCSAAASVGAGRIARNQMCASRPKARKRGVAAQAIVEQARTPASAPPTTGAKFSRTATPYRRDTLHRHSRWPARKGSAASAVTATLTIPVAQATAAVAPWVKRKPRRGQFHIQLLDVRREAVQHAP
jgi:hypothetical protein